MNSNLSPFLDPDTVASYPEDTGKKVPGLAALHRMTMLLLSEDAPRAAHVLVVGAGGGLELNALAQARPDWRFTGVDPSPAMLDIASKTISPYRDRVTLLPGTVETVQQTLFDGATCLLVLHFLDRQARLHTLSEIRRRLKPGSALVIAHHASPDGFPERWLSLSAQFGNGDMVETDIAARSARAMVDRLTLLSPAEEEALLKEAGFASPSLFYAAFSFRGWVARAA